MKNTIAVMIIVSIGVMFSAYKIGNKAREMKANVVEMRAGLVTMQDNLNTVRDDVKDIRLMLDEYMTNQASATLKTK